MIKHKQLRRPARIVQEKAAVFDGKIKVPSLNKKQPANWHLGPEEPQIAGIRQNQICDPAFSFRGKLGS
jgi:hypothetical protein